MTCWEHNYPPHEVEIRLENEDASFTLEITDSAERPSSGSNGGCYSWKPVG